MVRFTEANEMVVRRVSGYAFVAVLASCNVSSPPSSTGGVQFASDDGGSVIPDVAIPDSGSTSVDPRNAGEDAGRGSSESDASVAPQTCERGVVVVMGDYKSTNIAISKLDGTTLSGSFISSGATKPGLGMALSGDVVVPFEAPTSGRVVLLDRYGSNVITWIDLASANVISQLAVGTGFQSNPHDYLEVDEHRAFVSRYGTNPAPGTQAFDDGGDVLILDTTKPAITGRLAMPEEDPRLLPCPDSLMWLGKEVAVTLGRLSSDFSKIGDGRFVGVSPTSNTITWTVNITGLSNCGRLALSPSGKLAAIACSSLPKPPTYQYDPATSDIVIFDAASAPPKELRRLGVAKKLNAGIQPEIAFATEDAIFAKTFGGNATPGDTAFVANATTGEVTHLAAAAKAIVFGGIHCSPGCGDVCLLSDAERNKLRRWGVTAAGSLTALDDITVETVIGLPPRAMGGL